MIELPKPNGQNPMPDWLIFDFEASSLNEDSYPIEFGWSDLNLNSGSFLIRPDADWTDWNPDAASAHGIDRDLLLRDGISVQDAAARINYMAVGNRMLICDGGDSDKRWYRVLFEASGQVPELHPDLIRDFDLRLNTAVSLVCSPEEATAQLSVLCEMRDIGILNAPHRAEADALALAAMARASLDREYFDALVVADRQFRDRVPSPEDQEKNEIVKEILETISQSGLSRDEVAEVTGLDPRTVDHLYDRKVADFDVDKLNEIWMDVLSAPAPTRGLRP